MIKTAAIGLFFHIPNYKSTHQVRNAENKNGKGSGLFMFILNSLNFTTQNDLNINVKNIESHQIFSKTSLTFS